MRRNEIQKDLEELAFDFFYWFSRFEFALKENQYLKSYDVGANAEAGWDAYIAKYAPHFIHSDQTKRLIELNPKRQKVGANSTLQWSPVGLEDCGNDLCKVVRLLKTIRNNLFHGGKHGAGGWDDFKRNMELLEVGKLVLDQLARETSFEVDYTRHY